MKLERTNRVTGVESVTERLVSLITEIHIKPGERLPSVTGDGLVATQTDRSA
ncbi:MAG: hypothetical protein QOK29_3778 [Rhodospirillaceae bacterium]|jgi:DNA-binding FadR family transcriptional regulator|nr:hypothetical protein [Rhodospirillaceae bacterium]